jgi:glycosyltransferase involved in cell wall biosynthesis
MLAPKVIFVLPASGGGGGANSVVQEAIGLRRYGVPVSIAVPAEHQFRFAASYPELASGEVPLAWYANAAELAAQIAAVDLVCATTNGSVRHVAEAIERLPAGRRPRTAYYIQDYEPLFYQAGSPEWDEARLSYTRLPACTLFAKTRWLCNIVYENHGIRVAKVEPSLDHDIYYPRLSAAGERIEVLAMLRPQTPRRAPLRTLRIMQALAERYGGRIGLQVFGTDDTKLKELGIKLPPLMRNHGSLLRTEVPEVMRQATLFLDLSDYQAFGRTGLESMACACVPLVPSLGGSAEYAVDRVNGYAVDTRSDQAILQAVEHFVGLSAAQREQMKMAGMNTAARYTVTRTVLSELALFDGMTRRSA